MSETPNDKPTPPPFDFSGIPSLDDMKAKGQEALQNPPTISDKQKAIALTLVGTYVLFRIEKRMVRKVVTKVVQKDSFIIKEHLRQLTMAVDDLAAISLDKTFAKDTFLREMLDRKA